LCGHVGALLKPKAVGRDGDNLIHLVVTANATVLPNSSAPALDVADCLTIDLEFTVSTDPPCILANRFRRVAEAAKA